LEGKAEQALGGQRKDDRERELHEERPGDADDPLI
jgi:hypothetical protein